MILMYIISLFMGITLFAGIYSVSNSLKEAFAFFIGFIVLSMGFAYALG